MKIVIAPQGFKGSLTALEIARAIETGIKRAMPDAETVLVPVADGGDGTLQALVDSSGGRIVTSTVTGPLGKPVQAQWGAMGDGVTAVIEMARASGLALIKREERDPLHATTRGTGELVKTALDAGLRRFIVGIGGSATNDGGAGLAQSLGARLLDKSGMDLEPGGAALAHLDRIDVSKMDPRLKESKFTVACDVNNPLCGATGASAIFGPQKGATPEMVKQLDAALGHLADVIRRDIGANVKDRPGAGAAGGLGAGLMAFVDAELRAGVDIMLEAVGLEKLLPGTDLVITGEGQIDRSTVFNKAPVGVAMLAKKRGIPVFALAGSLGDGYQQVHQHGIDAVFSLVNGPMSLDDAMARTSDLISAQAEEIARAVLTATLIKRPSQ
ncbi:MAG: glycerate kinase [Dehalococcoidia bacterium]|nr:glycerate kinase [Dehalococcoidia bacterium]MSQ35067.1 glycerate kinase [Dehalococcoidia bacterium]